MQDFVPEFIVPTIAKKRWTKIAEVGASLGGSSDFLIGIPNVKVSIIDPCLDLDLREKYSAHPNVAVHVGISLEILPRLNDVFDCILLDGDHNWYTVYHELNCIHDRGLLRRGGMIFLHDVDWPYGYRDMYYQPETIPAEFRQPYKRGSVVRGRNDLAAGHGVNEGLYNATHEGGPRNGVMCGIKDFLNEHAGAYNFAVMRRCEGLGVIQSSASMTEKLAFLKTQCRFGAYNAITFPKRYIRNNFPNAYLSIKSAVGRN